MDKDDKSSDNKNLDKLKKSRNKVDKHMENVVRKEKCIDKNYLKEMLDKISDEIPVKKGKNDMILLDKNNPDDIEWWNDED
jgi:hypothetical protein